jgi:hypothetical protein
LEDHQLSEKGFNATIFQCMDRALSSLGDTAKLALYHQVATVYGLDPHQLRSRPLDVAQYLHKLLGDAGYAFIERLMIREIKTTFKLSMRDGVALSEAISEARRKFLSY